MLTCCVFGITVTRDYLYIIMMLYIFVDYSESCDTASAVDALTQATTIRFNVHRTNSIVTSQECVGLYTDYFHITYGW